MRDIPATVSGARPGRRDRRYRAWRDAKLRAREGSPPPAPLEVADPRRLSAAESRGLRRQLAAHNLAFYRCAGEVDAAALRALGEQLGLRRVDRHLCAERSGVAVITQRPAPAPGEFIPYTPRALNWHTDGYYLPARRRVRAFVLHCRQAAADGGANRFFDHELAYIALRDREPRWIEALSQRDVLTIPGYTADSGASRPDVAGPVFSVCRDGRLHMRYTARTRYAAWKPDSAVQEAVGFLREVLDDPRGDACRYRLSSGEGVICANLLHSREAYVDGHPAPRRTLLRVRYRDPPPGGEPAGP